MKKIIILISMIILSSCDVDKKLENNETNDKDDMNVIDKIWKQSLDKAIDLYDTKTRAS